ncbi:competence protein CoiA family protein [uncultured Streptococcus sp.]|uniref:competence protein CoiA n=1 Tax=uncultured Streptococcus sp. TaxID=83427 RepID=UPI0027DE3324|nr:competence protein CoiA family protein [uncultured Streptococcus sp.]
MLSALDQDGKLYNLLEKSPSRGVYFCPGCQTAVRLKAGKIMRPHFAHVNLESCDFYNENESAEHLNLKAGLFNSLASTEQVVVEQVLPDLNQIADLMVNSKLALEVQCSRLSEERLRERTHTYHQAGYQVRWLLGKKLWLAGRLTSLHKQFLYFSRNMGFHLWELDAEYGLLRLKYLIYEDLRGQVHYLEETCSFDGDIYAFLRKPYQAQSLKSYQVASDKGIVTYIQKQLAYGNAYWLARQEEAYLSGGNLLAQAVDDFYPQVRPPASKDGYCQIQQDLSAFGAAYFSYYQKQKDKSRQILYPPAFYDRIEEKT